MANPFKSGDKVLTLRKGIEIEATVRTTWNHEVQVRTTEGDLIWRTMKTIRSVTAPETDQPADPSPNPDSGAEVTQGEPPATVEPATVEPATVEPASEPGTVEPVIVEPGDEETPARDQPAEPEPQQTGKGAAKPKKGRKGILRKLMFDDNFDE